MKVSLFEQRNALNNDALCSEVYLEFHIGLPNAVRSLGAWIVVYDDSALNATLSSNDSLSVDSPTADRVMCTLYHLLSLDVLKLLLNSLL